LFGTEGGPHIKKPVLGTSGTGNLLLCNRKLQQAAAGLQNDEEL
jgi:hypothetical protein